MAKNDSNAEKATKEPGPFVILQPFETPDSAVDPETGEKPTLYSVVGEFVGKTSKQAIGQAVAQNGGGTYIAVPKRSFTARKVESVGVPRLKWS
jgi:hypothetical protein